MAETALSPKHHRALELADQRYGMALWYAFGAQDMRPDLAHIDPFHFASYHKQHAYDYHMEQTVVLQSVSQAFIDWVTAGN